MRKPALPDGLSTNFVTDLSAYVGHLAIPV